MVKGTSPFFHAHWDREYRVFREGEPTARYPITALGYMEVGRVIDLAFYQGGARQLRLGEEFHHNGLAIRCAQIARVPRGLDGRWDRLRLAQETVDLLRVHGAALRRHLITDVIQFADAPAFMADIAARRRHALQVVFDLSDR